MAKARLIARALGTSEKFAALGETAGLLGDFSQALFPLLVVNSDDYGRLEGSPFTVKVRIFPISAHSIADFDRALAAMDEVGLIHRYTSPPDRKQLIQIEGFERHQQGLQRRTRSEFPSISGGDGIVDEVQCNSEKIPLNRTEEKRTEEKVTEEKATGSKRRDTTKAREVVDLWNERRVIDGPGTKPLPRVGRLTSTLRAKIDSRLKMFEDLRDWRLLFDWLNQQAWCRAGVSEMSKTWVASLDWICKGDDVFRRNLENAVNDREQEQRTTPGTGELLWDELKLRLSERMDQRTAGEGELSIQIRGKRLNDAWQKKWAEYVFR